MAMRASPAVAATPHEEGAFARQVLQDYLADLKATRATGAGVPETSYYPALANLFNAVGQTLKPKVRCIIHTKDQGAGIPDGGLFTADQFQHWEGDSPIFAARKWGQSPSCFSAAPKSGQLPARGALEVKPPDKDLAAIGQTHQVKEYLKTYGIVVVSNLRGFLIVERGPARQPIPRESFSLAANEDDFWRNRVAHPHATAQQRGAQLVEFVKRACLHAAPLANPKDVAWFLASYARDALARVHEQKQLPALQAVRSALEEALGMKFTDDKGEHFFRSTLVQTIFYGLFSAWVAWHKENGGPKATFDWQKAEWNVRVPFIRALYEELAKPSRLGPLGLVEVLDWAAGVLNRVDREEFFQRFHEDQAVQYFYEPFLEAYDPALRKELGVWYTPPEIVKYQVARVDTVLREELELPDGLADPNVVVLDPCCGTGAYLVEVLRRVAATLRDKGGDALVASDLKRAAMERVFGFEILPAPFVVAHLQLGLMLQAEGAPLSHKRGERVGVYLTNALTGWEPPRRPKANLLFPEMEEEREAAERVKRHAPILVILGNPPYNAFAGVSPQEEEGLVEPYKKGLNKPATAGGWGIKKFNLDDLYVRFFRLAERRIAEMTGKGVVSFISNHSWISEPSFVVLRKHLLESFDKLWIENLHGNRKISEYAPDGRTSETVFAIRGFSVGIQQGVATSLWVKTGKARKKAVVRFRDDIDAAKAADRRIQLLATLRRKRINAAYTLASPRAENRLSFRPEKVSAEYLSWPKVLELCALAPFNGPVERRGNSLIRFPTDRAGFDRLRAYLDPAVRDEAIRELELSFMTSSGEFQAEAARASLKGKVAFAPERIVRYPFKPFDVRLAYLDPAIHPLFSRPSPQLLKQRFAGNAFFISRDTADKTPEGPPFYFSKLVCDYDCISGHARHFPLLLKNRSRLERGAQASLFALLGERALEDEAVANLSAAARRYLALGQKSGDADDEVRAASLIWMHALAIGFSPAYLSENADGARRDWPRIPLPRQRRLLETSAALGERLAALLDTEAEVSGVTSGKITALLRSIAPVAKVGGGAIDPMAGDLALTAGWGHAGGGGVTMPAKGKVIQREYDLAERKALEAEAAVRGASVRHLLRLLGPKTCDVYLNDVALWRNVPTNVWEFRLGGYQVLKKWLSYREAALLGRALTPDEARELTAIARRIAGVLLLQPELDENYQKVKAAPFDWPTATAQ